MPTDSTDNLVTNDNTSHFMEPKSLLKRKDPKRLHLIVSSLNYYLTLISKGSVVSGTGYGILAYLPIIYTNCAKSMLLCCILPLLHAYRFGNVSNMLVNVFIFHLVYVSKKIHY